MYWGHNQPWCSPSSIFCKHIFDLLNSSVCFLYGSVIVCVNVCMHIPYSWMVFDCSVLKSLEFFSLSLSPLSLSYWRIWFYKTWASIKPGTSLPLFLLQSLLTALCDFLLSVVLCMYMCVFMINTGSRSVCWWARPLLLWKRSWLAHDGRAYESRSRGEWD